MNSKLTKRRKVQFRIRKSLKGTGSKPRLAVFKSNKGIYCQLIDDVAGVTIANANSKGITGTKIEVAAEVGKKIGAAAKSANIDSIVFDRSGYVYHGRIKSLADGAREAGLNF